MKVLDEIDRGGYAHLAVPSALDGCALDDRDKGLVTELVYGVTRNRLALDWLISRYASRSPERIEKPVLNILRLGVYQLVYLDKIPEHAAVSTSVDLAKRRFRPGVEKFVNAVLRNVVRNRGNLPWPDRGRELTSFLSVYYSHPRWLVKSWIEELGLKTTEALLEADNKRPKVTLRVNDLKISAIELMNLLSRDGIEATAGSICSNAVILSGQNIPENILENGLVYAQNEASMAVSLAVAPQRGQSIIDLCAAPGGKATHLAQIMGNVGRIDAVDINGSRLKMVKDNAERLGVDIINYIEGDSAQPVGLGEADHVLVDAPCSGLGVLSRRPDSRWRKSSEDIPRLADLQFKILSNAAGLVKRGGDLTYAVCTISDAETAGLARKFEAANPALKPVRINIPGLKFPEAPYARFWPQIHGTDGMFIAKWRRN